MRPERTIRERIDGSIRRFETDVDCFVATTTPDGRPNVAPLSVVWHGGVFVICTRRSTHTVKNIQHQPVARLVYGPTRDVVIVDVRVDIRELSDVGDAALTAFHRHVGWNIAEETNRYVALVCMPGNIQAWREEPERTIMENGRWLE
jgi:hypothetical protein